MDELGFRPCRECGKRALIELADGNGRICARCYVRRRRIEALGNRTSSRAMENRSFAQTPVRMGATEHHAR